MSIEIIALEGTRGGGKSTVANHLRQQRWGSTLINLTGFADSGPAGLAKITDYYTAVMALIRELAKSDSHYIVIFDRLFISEAVYSQIYKDYDFMPVYRDLCTQLLNLADKVHLFFLTADSEALQYRLNRFKARLFDNVPENVIESLKQQEMYRIVMDRFQQSAGYTVNLKYHEIDTSNLSIEDVQQQVIQAIGR